MPRLLQALAGAPQGGAEKHFLRLCLALQRAGVDQRVVIRPHPQSLAVLRAGGIEPVTAPFGGLFRSEEHTSELQSLMRISYAVFCLKKKTQKSMTSNVTYVRYITNQQTAIT